MPDDRGRPARAPRGQLVERRRRAVRPPARGQRADLVLDRQFFAAALACAFAAAATTPGRRRVAWVGLGLLATAFSIDEGASLHEMLGREVGEEQTLGVTQPAAALVVCGAIVLAGTRVGDGQRAMLWAAAAVLLGSQALASAGGLLVEDDDLLWVLESLEDVSEMAVGSLLLAAALPTAAAAPPPAAPSPMLDNAAPDH